MTDRSGSPKRMMLITGKNSTIVARGSVDNRNGARRGLPVELRRPLPRPLSRIGNKFETIQRWARELAER
jgi:restriction endonuclease Mrr